MGLAEVGLTGLIDLMDGDRSRDADAELARALRSVLDGRIGSARRVGGGAGRDRPAADDAPVDGMDEGIPPGDDLSRAEGLAGLADAVGLPFRGRLIQLDGHRVLGFRVFLGGGELDRAGVHHHDVIGGAVGEAPDARAAAVVVNDRAAGLEAVNVAQVDFVVIHGLGRIEDGLAHDGFRIALDFVEGDGGADAHVLADGDAAGERIDFGLIFRDHDLAQVGLVLIIGDFGHVFVIRVDLAVLVAVEEGRPVLDRDAIHLVGDPQDVLLLVPKDVGEVSVDADRAIAEHDQRAVIHPRVRDVMDGVDVKSRVNGKGIGPAEGGGDRDGADPGIGPDQQGVRVELDPVVNDRGGEILDTHAEVSAAKAALAAGGSQPFEADNTGQVDNIDVGLGVNMHRPVAIHRAETMVRARGVGRIEGKRHGCVGRCVLEGVGQLDRGVRGLHHVVGLAEFQAADGDAPAMVVGDRVAGLETVAGVEGDFAVLNVRRGGEESVLIDLCAVRDIGVRVVIEVQVVHRSGDGGLGALRGALRPGGKEPVLDADVAVCLVKHVPDAVQLEPLNLVGDAGLRVDLDIPGSLHDRVLADEGRGGIVEEPHGDGGRNRVLLGIAVGVRLVELVRIDEGSGLHLRHVHDGRGDRYVPARGANGGRIPDSGRGGVFVLGESEAGRDGEGFRATARMGARVFLPHEVRGFVKRAVRPVEVLLEEPGPDRRGRCGVILVGV